MFESFWFFKFSSTIKYCSCYPKIFTYHFSLFSFQGAIFSSAENCFRFAKGNPFEADNAAASKGYRDKSRTTDLFKLRRNFASKIS